MVADRANMPPPPPDPSQDLGIGGLVPREMVATIAGERLTFRARGLVELARMYQHVKPAMELLESAPEGADISDGLISALTDEAAAQGLLAAAAIGVDKPLEWVAELGGTDQLELVSRVLEVNADFFARRLLPTMAKTVASWMARLLAGQGSSSSLSTTGTRQTQ
ncbi:hypothetical protein BGP89_11370 [Luteimonas sp. JM171]|uniref:hypothetical protein n=1 Tax=Luteimonas sp. JM171 TaxID=1896164 RepID=UPI0008579FD1|nr:hypothetical protein [Luteimonas sp. JM171]AOH36879.1 hypothetical protein BGP89_11370 [Luteimonas sp. JM171]